MAKNPKPLRKHKRKFYRAMQKSGTTVYEAPAMPPPLSAKERIGRRPISLAQQLGLIFRSLTVEPDLTKLKHHPKGAPGSPMAKESGCKCAVMDNRYGLGMYVEPDGTVIYSVNMSCPIHGEPEFFNEP